MLRMGWMPASTCVACDLAMSFAHSNMIDAASLQGREAIKFTAIHTVRREQR